MTKVASSIRIQITLTVDQYEKLVAESEKTGASMAEIIRRALASRKAK